MTISRPVAKHISRLKQSAKSLAIARSSTEELNSFGVYLGSFDSPATPDQARLLSEWDVVALDPLARGVADAVAACAYASPQVLGRLDVRSLMESERGTNGEQTIRSIRILDETISSYFKGSGNSNSPFTAVLLANFVEHFSPQVLNELVGYINLLGYAVWLEMAMSGPGYVSGPQCRDIDMKFIGGVIYRNGTIRHDGGQQDFHQMGPMRAAQRAIAAQRVAHGPPMMLWETVDDHVEHQYAVTQRCFNWCLFNSALCWIGNASALVDAQEARIHTVTEKPLGALMWMKNDKNMQAHNIWRANDEVRATSQWNSFVSLD